MLFEVILKVVSECQNSSSSKSEKFFVIKTNSTITKLFCTYKMYVKNSKVINYYSILYKSFKN